MAIDFKNCNARTHNTRNLRATGWCEVVVVAEGKRDALVVVVGKRRLEVSLK